MDPTSDCRSRCKCDKGWYVAGGVSLVAITIHAAHQPKRFGAFTVPPWNAYGREVWGMAYEIGKRRIGK